MDMKRRRCALIGLVLMNSFPTDKVPAGRGGDDQQCKEGLGPRAAIHRTAAAAGGAGERLVHDAPDGASAAPALRAAAEAAIDLPGGARGVGRSHGCAHVVVAQYVTRTDDHGWILWAGFQDDNMIIM
jgi:hypothetical protein